MLDSLLASVLPFRENLGFCSPKENVFVGFEEVMVAVGISFPLNDGFAEKAAKGLKADVLPPELLKDVKGLVFAGTATLPMVLPNEKAALPLAPALPKEKPEVPLVPLLLPNEKPVVVLLVVENEKHAGLDLDDSSPTF